MLKLTNTLSGRLEDFTPLDGSTVRMYACGPTVYNYIHIGNFRAYVFEDVLRRHLLSKGWGLKHVMNVTDVDDKIIKRSIETGQDIKTYTEPYTRARSTGQGDRGGAEIAGRALCDQSVRGRKPAAACEAGRLRSLESAKR